MKKIIGLILCLVLILSLGACSTGGSNIETDMSEQPSPEERYNEANSLISEKKYKEAIEILENIDYKNSKVLKNLVAYVYACELFNKHDFSTAYNYFEKSDGYLDANRNMRASAYYAGVEAVNSDQHWKSIDWFRKVLDDNRFKSEAEKHIIEVTTALLGAAWIGSYTNSNGKTLQVEFKYFRSKDNLYIAHADRSDGYRFIASITGSLEVGAEKCKYYHSETRYGGSWDAIEVSFSSSNRMYISCDSSTIGEAIEGYYTAKSAAFSTYKIDNVEYPTLDIPKIDFEDEFNDNDNKGDNIPENKTNDEIEVVYKNESSSTRGCTVTLDDCSILYDEKTVIIKTTVKSVNYNISAPGPGIWINFCGENGKYIKSLGQERVLASNQGVGAKIEFSFNIPEGTKKIEICDYAQWP